jgi:multicomponent Na+:H+ antiporter subunit G
MNDILAVITILLLVLAWGIIIFGMVAIFKLKNVYSRIISATTIDSVASLTIIIALLVFKVTNYEYVIRFILLIGFLLVTNPISSHVNIRSAYLTGYNLKSLNRHDGTVDLGDPYE